MTKIEIILSVVCTISILLNIGVFAYARSVITQLLSVSEELGDLKTMIDSFFIHSKEVYEMEMFYGEQTLQALMDHARSFREYMEEFDFIYIPEEEEPDAETQQIEEV